MLSIEVTWLRLNEAICQWERDTGRGYTAILIPHSEDEPIRMTLDGKPTPDGVTTERVLDVALASRGDQKTTLPAPEEMAERLVGSSDSPTQIAMRNIIADAIRADRTGR